jgi:hypothetical protein
VRAEFQVLRQVMESALARRGGSGIAPGSAAREVLGRLLEQAEEAATLGDDGGRADAPAVAAGASVGA